MDAVDSSGCSMPVSVWVRKLANEEKRCLVAMEPVQRTNAKVTFNTKVCHYNKNTFSKIMF